MSTLHITPGGTAADHVREALAHAQRNERVIEHDDDLCIGPLLEADEIPRSRAAFWQRVYSIYPSGYLSGSGGCDFLKRFEQLATTLNELITSEHPVVIWHGQNASDQLMLRRIAYFLRNTPQRLNEVRLSRDDLPEGCGRFDGATAVGMYEPALLEKKLPDIAPISILRISRLALEWQGAKQANAQLRLWRDNHIKSASFAELDAFIIERATPEWQKTMGIIGALMGEVDIGAIISDAVACWRCKEAAAAGLIELSSDAPQSPKGWRALQVRAARANAGSMAEPASPLIPPASQ